MANVLLLSVAEDDPRDNSWNRGAYARLKESFELGRSSHCLVDDPAAADLILFAELNPGPLLPNVRRHPWVRGHREKCFLFLTLDRFIPFLPGVYVSIEKSWYSPGRVRSGFYLSTLENPYIDYDPARTARDYLYSFVGSVRTAPVRAGIAKLRHERSLFVDTSSQSLPVWFSGSMDERHAFWQRYAESGHRSKFVLCPRGYGAASVRLFETMRLGRAPVILSDEWVPPLGPAWEDFSIRVPEREVANVPRLLEEQESEAEEMGRRARLAWEDWFSPERAFDTVVDWCLDLQRERRLPEAVARFTVWPQLLRPRFLREYAQSLKLTGTVKRLLRRA